MKIRAAVLRQMGLPVPYASSQPLAVETVELDPPAPDEVLVRVLAAGLCHSDLSVIDGSRPRPMAMVLGHEAAGEIVEVGSDVMNLRPGDRVVFSFIPRCGFCQFCVTGRPVLCEAGAAANLAGTLLGGGIRWKDARGEVIHHHLGVSAFAEFVVASARSVVRVDQEIAPKIAAVFGCAVMTGVGAVVNTAKVAAGESVAVFGLGGVGLSALLGAHAAGANPLIAVDVNAGKLKMARELGATGCVHAGECDAVEALRDLSGGGVQYAIESVGDERVLAQAYAATRRGGTTVTVGLPGSSRLLSIPAVSLVAEERTIKGSYMGSCVPSRDLPRFIALYRAGLLPVDRLVTHDLKLDDINAGFDRLARAEAIRQVVLFP